MQIKNRGAITNPESRFETETREFYDDGWEVFDEEELPTLETILYPDKAKSIINYNDSPDLSFDASINPYRGCEHGCIYCYARPAHGYMNLSSGLDFETKIFYKVDAAKLLEQDLAKKKYVCEPIVIGANTDPYQPTESKLKVTRSILEVCHRYKQPIAIITKNAMIERDLDILSDMAKDNLVKIAISITTLKTGLKILMEPRTSAPSARLRAVRNLRDNNICVRVMAAPMIPMINDTELESILQAASEAGAEYASYTLVRLPHEVKILFREWLAKHFPERAAHVMSLIQQMRGGKDYDATFGKRMVGEGEFAKLLSIRFEKACKRFKLNIKPSTPLNLNLFTKPNLSNQLSLF